MKSKKILIITNDLYAKIKASIWLIRKIGLFKFVMIFGGILLQIKRKIITVFDFRGEKISMQIDSLRTDISMLTECFYFESYLHEKLSIGKNGLIIDAGGYKGDSTVYLSKMYPLARFVVLEANSSLIDYIKTNLELNKIKRYKIINKALCDFKGTIKFKINDNLQYSRGSNDGETFVETITIEDINNQFGRISLLKLDIEGAEEDVLVRSNLSKVDAIIMEAHNDRINLWRIIKKLRKEGFKKIKLKNSNLKLLNLEDENAIVFFVKEHTK